MREKKFSESKIKNAIGLCINKYKKSCMDLTKKSASSFKIIGEKADRTYDVGVKALLTVRGRSQRERGKRQNKLKFSLDRLASCLYSIYE